MRPDPADTIVAVASPPGPAERAIVRVSGPRTPDIVARLFAADSQPNSPPAPAATAGPAWAASRTARRWPGVLQLPDFSVPIPADLLYWPGNRSYTGQLLAELHLIGCQPILESLLEQLCAAGARLAQRGEFTMRAFLAGRMDLLQAEAVHEVIQATDHEELQRALSQLGGGLTGRLRQLRTDLIALIGDLEAGLDFVEEDIEFVSREEILRRTTLAIQLIAALLSDAGQRLPAGRRRRVVLAGLPNAGKSTLFNTLLQQNRAIVSEQAGTTRDFVSASFQLAGLTLELIDTAGCEVTDDAIMQQAQQQRLEQLQAADLVLWCRACDLTPLQQQQEERLFGTLTNSLTAVLLVLTRCDLSATQPEHQQQDASVVRISCHTGAGLPQLRQRLELLLGSHGAARSELLGSSAVRCRDSLQGALQALQQAQQAAATAAGDELVSLELRQALQALQTILGEVYTDDLLDHIFSHFCIGK
jgi:tRNA modification GTPase